jgi:hypothetical protein
MTLALIPLTAIAVYALFRSLKLHVPTNVVLYVITMPLGFWFFFRACGSLSARGMPDSANPAKQRSRR